MCGGWFLCGSNLPVAVNEVKPNGSTQEKNNSGELCPCWVEGQEGDEEARRVDLKPEKVSWLLIEIRNG